MECTCSSTRLGFRSCFLLRHQCLRQLGDTSFQGYDTVMLSLLCSFCLSLAPSALEFNLRAEVFQVLSDVVCAAEGQSWVTLQGARYLSAPTRRQVLNGLLVAVRRLAVLALEGVGLQRVENEAVHLGANVLCSAGGALALFL